MLIHIVNISLIIYWWFLSTIFKKAKTINSLEYNKSKGKRNILLIIPFVQIYLMLSLKNLSVGTDTIPYLNGFNAIIYTTWQSIFDFSINNLVFNFERGFIILSKLITTFTKDFAVYSAIIYAIMIIPLYKFIKKHSTMPFVSVILFITLGFLNFYFSGMRQAVAISLIILSYDFIIKRKFWKFTFLILVATSIHTSAIFFLPAYFLMNLVITPTIGILYILSLMLAYIFRFQIIEFVTRFVYSGVEILDTGAYTLLLVVLVTFFFGLMSYKGIIKQREDNKLLYNIIAVAAMLMIFNTTTNIGLRVANYYYIFMILFIPNILIHVFRAKFAKYTILIVVVAFTIAYYFKTGVHSLDVTPYKFFWE